MYRKSVLLFSSALSVAGCTVSTVNLAKPGRRIATAVAELPLPPGVNGADDSRPYLLGPKDVLSIQVYGEPDLSLATVTVNGDGTIELPLLGVLVAQGRTTEQLTHAIELGLRKFLNQPSVAINVASAQSQMALLDGAVLKPGLYPIIGRTTLQQLVAEAGGLQDYAVLEQFLVVRRINGRNFAAIYNLKAIRNAGEPDPEIFSGDKVVVGNSAIQRTLKAFLPYSAVPLLFLTRP